MKKSTFSSRKLLAPALILMTLGSVLVGCSSHVGGPGGTGFGQAIGDLDGVAGRTLVPALVAAGQKLGVPVDEQSIELLWNDGSVYLAATRRNVSLSDADLARGVVTGLVYFPQDLTDDTPAGLYATKVTIEPDSNEGTTAFVDASGRTVGTTTARRVFEEGETPRAVGTPKIVPPGTTPRFTFGEQFAAAADEKTTVTTETYVTETTTNPDGSTTTRDICTFTKIKTKTSTQ